MTLLPPYVTSQKGFASPRLVTSSPNDSIEETTVSYNCQTDSNLMTGTTV
jgi:hypothetical protein